MSQPLTRRRTVRNVREVVNKIDQFVERYNSQAKLLVWNATSDSILEKIERLCEYVTGTQHYGDPQDDYI